MTTLNLTLNQIDEQMQRLNEIKAFLEGIELPKIIKQEAPKQELQLTIHEYWNK